MEYAAIFPETVRLLSHYDYCERGHLYEAMVFYATENIEPDWPEDWTEWYVWEALKGQIDRARSKSEQNKANACGKKRTAANRSETERTEAERPIKEKENEKEIKDDDDIKNAHACETPFGTIELDPVIILIQKELNGLTQSHYDDLEVFRRDLPDELIEEAVNEAVAHGARSWAYVRSILQTYIRENIRSVGAARAMSEKRRLQPKDNGGFKSSGWNYDQRNYSEDELASRTDSI